MKNCFLQLWVRMANTQSGQGQRSRSCKVEYEVNGLGAKTLYHVTSITDKRTGEEYDVENTMAINNGDIDEQIAAANPAMVKMAKQELGVDLKTAPKKVAKPIKKIVQSTEEDYLKGLTEDL